MIDDFGLIVSSFQSQYGVRLSKEAGSMKWSEFCDLLTGLGPDTALMRVVSIRSEEDKEMLKHFTPAQRRMRSQWRTRTAQKKNPKDVAQGLAQIQAMFASLSKGGEGK
ncbi:MAG: bacteriophage Gp15 family protein [Clostridiales bacterium]|nr:bacteriophage Gp15 family protein [Clostridiales bacterium]MCC8100039.1 bacteriophage Gp15 family protein [Clostridiales bacterium]